MSVVLRYLGHCVEPLPRETVLDALLRIGADVAFSCKGGSCQTCMLQCTDGTVPDAAQRGLADHLRASGYLLPCRCIPNSSMTLRPKQPHDMITRCVLCEVLAPEMGDLRVWFEPMRAMHFRMGQTLRVITGGECEPELMLLSDPGQDFLIEGRLILGERIECPDWLRPGAPFGREFEVRGPFDVHARASEQPTPDSDPGLWGELENGRVVRAVLEDFYATVYADDRLRSYFERTTIDRAIDKQFSFLQQCMTGVKSYFGDRPRNAHHWMVISNDLFDYRQQLMVGTLRAHGLTESQIRRWTRFEEHYRVDIVKETAWPRRIGTAEIAAEGFDVETLDEATLCDYCGDEIAAGISVVYHRRLGTVSCAHCASEVTVSSVEPIRA